MATREWIVHPNRSAIGPDQPGRNGHYRSLSGPPTLLAEETFLARIALPPNLSHAADSDGSVTFAGHTWRFVVCMARTFAIKHLGADIPPFGYTDRGRWYWWDNTTTEQSILEGPQAMDYVREYLEQMYPDTSIELTDRR